MAKKAETMEQNAREQSPKAQAGQPAEGAEPQTEEKAEAKEAEEADGDSDVPGAAAGGVLRALEEEKEEYKDALIRERADFENYKKRNAELSAVSYRNGIADTVTDILPVLDNFDRALCAESCDKAYAEGMAMIMRQLKDALKELGVEEIAADAKFDPNLHNAVMQADEEGFETNDIVETLQKGYRLKDRILRHAMVKVNK